MRILLYVAGVLNGVRAFAVGVSPLRKGFQVTNRKQWTVKTKIVFWFVLIFLLQRSCISIVLPKPGGRSITNRLSFTIIMRCTSLYWVSCVANLVGCRRSSSTPCRLHKLRTLCQLSAVDGNSLVGSMCLRELASNKSSSYLSNVCGLTICS